MKRVAFICTENANRSQMAEAFARALGDGVLHAYSAGSRPSGEVSPRAVEAMAVRGYDLSGQRSKGLDELPGEALDVLVTMGCGDSCPWLEAGRRLEWELPDPRDLAAGDYAGVRDEIERRVRALIAELDESAAE